MSGAGLEPAAHAAVRDMDHVEPGNARGGVGGGRVLEAGNALHKASTRNGFEAVSKSTASFFVSLQVFIGILVQVTDILPAWRLRRIARWLPIVNSRVGDKENQEVLIMDLPW